MTKTVYLDYANWIYLERNINVRSVFLNAIQNNTITPILSFIHILEIAQSGQKSRNSMISFLENIESSNKLLWIRGLTSIVNEEIYTYFKAWITKSSITPIIPFTKSLVEALEGSKNMLWTNISVVKHYPISKHVDNIFKTGQLEGHRKTRITYASKSLFLSDLRRSRGLKGLTEEEKIKWIISLVPNTITLSSGLICHVTEEEKNEFARQFNYNYCPAFSTKLAFYDGRNIIGEGAKESEVEDHFHLVGIAYCDQSFVDGSTYELLKQGGLKVLPNRNSDFKKWVSSLNN